MKHQQHSTALRFVEACLWVFLLITADGITAHPLIYPPAPGIPIAPGDEKIILARTASGSFISLAELKYTINSRLIERTSSTTNVPARADFDPASDSLEVLHELGDKLSRISCLPSTGASRPLILAGFAEAFMRSVVETASVSPEEILSYYREHGKEYSIGAVADFHCITVDGYEKAMMIYGRLAAGDSFAALARFSIDPYRLRAAHWGRHRLENLSAPLAAAIEKSVALQSQRLRTLSVDNGAPGLSTTASGLALLSLDEPGATLFHCIAALPKGRWAVFRIDSFVPRHEISFRAARAGIRRRLLEARQMRLQDDLLARLRSVHACSYCTDNLSYLFARPVPPAVLKIPLLYVEDRAEPLSLLWSKRKNEIEFLGIRRDRQGLEKLGRQFCDKYLLRLHAALHYREFDERWPWIARSIKRSLARQSKQAVQKVFLFPGRLPACKTRGQK